MNSDLENLKHSLAAELPLLRDRYGVASLSLFGSYVRGEQRPESDLDVLVTFHCTPGLLGFIELENHLSDLLGKRVDLVLRDALKSDIGTRVLAEAVPI
jgi:predicted nucleotidyltransferase